MCKKMNERRLLDVVKLIIATGIGPCEVHEISLLLDGNHPMNLTLGFPRAPHSREDVINELEAEVQTSFAARKGLN